MKGDSFEEEAYIGGKQHSKDFHINKSNISR